MFPVVVALHWLGADHASLMGPGLGLDRYLVQHVADGGLPFAIAAPDGGSATGTARGRRRGRHGHDGLAAAARGSGLRLYDDRPPGWSMGGYGALRLAGSRVPTAPRRWS